MIIGGALKDGILCACLGYTIGTLLKDNSSQKSLDAERAKNAVLEEKIQNLTKKTENVKLEP